VAQVLGLGSSFPVRTKLQEDCANEREICFCILGASRSCQIIFEAGEEDTWVSRLLENVQLPRNLNI
jgi:hypothetical protein